MLVGFAAKNHPQQATDDEVDDRWTPRDLFDARHALHRFTVDAAASDANHLLPRYWTRETNGLLQSWEGERVWCNPPFSDLRSWVTKAHEETRRGCVLVDMLLPANRCEQGWWQDMIEPYRDRDLGVRTEFIRGRTRFGHPDGWNRPGKGDRPPFGCVLVTWTPPRRASSVLERTGQCRLFGGP